jgi:uncharacterized membrane protein
MNNNYELLAMLRRRWHEMRASFWFVPGAIVLGAVGLASVLIAADVSIGIDLPKRWPLVFGAGAAGSRGLLTAVASSMITVAGVVFSITIVALSLTSSQYTSRVLRNFMRDTINQTVLGVFVGIFAYCLVVLRTIRGGDEGAFVPSLAVLGGMVLAFVGIAFLIYFIHHIAMSIQASSIIAAAAGETLCAIDRQYPETLGETVDEGDDILPAEELAAYAWRTVPAPRTGYVESFDEEGVLAWARAHATVVRMERAIGEFVIEGETLTSVAETGASASANTHSLNRLFAISRQRTVDQDAAFGIRQIVDVALKALSPGINDTTTAVMCVDYLAAILVRLAPRRIARSHRRDKGELRLIVRAPGFEGLLGEAFDQIRRSGSGNVAVLQRLLLALERVGKATLNVRRRQALRRHADLTASLGQKSAPALSEEFGVQASLVHLALVRDGEMGGAATPSNPVNPPRPPGPARAGDPTKK